MTHAEQPPQQQPYPQQPYPQQPYPQQQQPAAAKPPFPLWPFYVTLALIAAPLLFMLIGSLAMGSSTAAAFGAFLMLIIFVGIPLAFLIAVDVRRRQGSTRA